MDEGRNEGVGVEESTGDWPVESTLETPSRPANKFGEPTRPRLSNWPASDFLSEPGPQCGLLEGENGKLCG